jgi:hypothetical protein
MLRRLRDLGRLSAGDRWLLFRATAAVMAFRLALWVVPYRFLARLRPAVRAVPGREASPPQRIAWSVRAAGRRIPRATCLTRALAGRWLLERAGHPATLHYGWRNDADGRFRAHAWLESGGRVLIGSDEDLDAYHPLSRRGAAAPPSSTQPTIPAEPGV